MATITSEQPARLRLVNTDDLAGQSLAERMDTARVAVDELAAMLAPTDMLRMA